MKTKEIAFWGSEPPPIGGMNVHIKRLSEFLKENDWQVFQYNFKKDIKRGEPYILNVRHLWIWYLKLWLTKSPKIHYVISTTGYVRFLASLLTIIGKKVVIRVGGRSLENDIQRGGVKKYLNIWSLKLCTSFIGVNEKICSLAMKYTTKEKIHHITGFIPPSGSSELPPIVSCFYNTDDLKIAVTGQIVNEGSEDIYGLYHVLDSLTIIQGMGVKFRCCIVSYTIAGDNTEAIKYFENKIEKLGLKNEVLLFHNEKELWPILKECDLFIRSSITDGDANSIRESLFFNKVVIASNCVDRPGSCILYETQDSSDLAKKIKSVLNCTVSNKIDEGENKLNNEYLILHMLNGILDKV